MTGAMPSDPFSLIDSGDPRVEAGAMALWAFLGAEEYGGARRPWSQATEVDRDKMRLMAAVVLEAALALGRQEGSVREKGEMSVEDFFWTPARGPAQASVPIEPGNEPVSPDLAKAFAFLRKRGLEF